MFRMKPSMSLRVRLLKSRGTGLPFRNVNNSNNDNITIRLSLVKRVIAALCVVLFVYVLLENHTAISDLESFQPFPVDMNLDSQPSVADIPQAKRVKIYVYDMPEKFNYGVVERYWMARGLLSTNYPSHQYMAEWHLFSDLTRPESLRVGSPVARVSDPEDADLFFVPFFATLSLAVDLTTRQNENDVGMELEMLEWLEGREEWRRRKGRAHVFVASHPLALNGVMAKVRNSVLLVSDFERLRAKQAGSFIKDVIVPHSYQVTPFAGEIGVENRNTLLFFMGARHRKEVNTTQGSRIRDELLQLLANEDDVKIKYAVQSQDNRRIASRGMHLSKFCLNPVGDTPTSCRLFNSIVSLCIPVIISDDIDLPFEDVIDYTKIAIFVHTSVALKPGFLVSMLRAITTEKIIEYQEELKRVRHYFAYGTTTVNEIWRQLAQKLPLIKLMSNLDKRLVRNLKPQCLCICTNQTGVSLTNL